MKLTIRFLSMLAVSGPLFLTGQSLFAQGACCGTPTVTQRVVYKTIYEREPVTAYKLQTEQVLEEREITVQTSEWVTEPRQRKYTVAKPVTETETREERYTVLKPVKETSYREEEYDQVDYVTETQTRQDRVIVQRPVTETQMREQQYTVRRPVQETVYQDQSYTTYSPVTSYYNQTVDMGGYVNQLAYQPGNVRNRLTWVPRGYAVDPVTGAAVFNRAGFRWVPYQAPGVLQPTTTYMPNYVTQQVPVTSYQPQVVAQKVPVNVTRYVDELVTQQTPVSVTRMEQYEEVRETPVTVQKPVVTRMVRKIPIETIRYEREEYARPVTYAVQKMVTEEVVEDYNVQVQQYRTEVRKIQVPKTISNWVPYQTYKLVPKTVVMKVPVGSYDETTLDGTTTYYAPARPAAATTAPTLPPRIISAGPARRIDGGAQGAVTRPEDPTVPVAPADKKPSLQQKPKIEGPQNGPEAPAADPAAPAAPAPADAPESA